MGGTRTRNSIPIEYHSIEYEYDFFCGNGDYQRKVSIDKHFDGNVILAFQFLNSDVLVAHHRCRISMNLNGNHSGFFNA